MSTGYPPDKPYPPAPRKNFGSTAIIVGVLGCAGAMFVGVLLCGGLAVYGVRWGMQQVDAVAKEYEEKGYRRQLGQVIHVSETPPEKTVYVCQMLTIAHEIDVDIAIISQVAEIKADVHGDVDFMGQVLKLESGCVIEGELRVKNSQVIEILGEVKGKISGNWMDLKYQGKNYGPSQSPSAPSGDEDQPTPPTPTPSPKTPPAPAAPAVPSAPSQPAPAEAQSPPEGD